MSTDLDAPTATIVVPTRARPSYLRVALASIAPQAVASAAELLVVEDDVGRGDVRAVCERFGARHLAHGAQRGLNFARNSGVASSRGELVVFVDDDVEVCAGWLDALLVAARAHPEVDVFTGPVQARLEGSPPRTCGRERPPITSLQLGERETFTRFAWGANMAIRRAALERIGPFDLTLDNAGDEQEWQERLWRERPTVEQPPVERPREQLPVKQPPVKWPSIEQPPVKWPTVEGGEADRAGAALYVPGAALIHRRDAADSRLRALCRSAFARGRAARRFDAWRSQRPSLLGELRTLLGCCGHVLRRRCPAGLTMVAHSAGRLVGGLLEARASLFARTPPLRTPPLSSAAPPLSPQGPPSPQGPTHTKIDDFLSGESGTVGGLDRLRRAAIDARDDALQLASGRSLRLLRAARRGDQRARRVLALCIEREHNVGLVDAIEAELSRSRHQVRLRREPTGSAGKFENLNRMLAPESLYELDWLLVLDDDIALPHGFLDRFLFLAERFSLDLAQPAHRARSHAAWQVTRRRRDAVVRETRFVEIGPATAFARGTFSTLLPFPPLRMGWGLDLHWAALAAEHGWRCGVLDAVAISHRHAPAGAAYSREQAIAEARSFLRGRAYLPATDAQRTIATHRRW